MGEEITEERGNWTGKLDFILSCIGFAVGLGNVWRFPYLAYRNGGASFLIPYIIMLFVAGLPLFFMELAIGQFSSQGPITVWKMAPAFTGIGYAMVIISSLVGIYYNVIIAYAIYYMFVSFVNLDDDLPWEECGNWWNTDSCRSDAWPDLSDSKYNLTEKMSLLWSDLYDKTCVSMKFVPTSYKDYDTQQGLSADYTEFFTRLTNKYPAISGFSTLTWQAVENYKDFSSCKTSYTTASEEYWKYFVLRQQYSEDIGDLGDISVKLCLTLVLAWILIFGCLMKGIKTSGKVVYFTATFPYAILIVLLIRGLTLEGHEEGVDFYVVPEWDKLTDAKIWNDAATQIFYSLGVGFGGLLTMSSYNKFKNNCYRDALLVSFINCGTSIFAGFAIFSLLGHMAHQTNQKVEDVATSGVGLAFVAYPDGISRLPGSPVWAFLFFFMILTLGLDSQFAFMETVISSISDMFPNYLRKNKTSFTLVICIIGFLCGIPQTTHGGIRVLNLLNDYSGSYNLMVVALLECVCVSYVYGMDNFRNDIKMMIGFRPKIYWLANWYVITPAAIIFIISLSAEQHKRTGYDGVENPDWAEALGWLMVGIPILIIIIVFFIELWRKGWPACVRPTSDWMPAQPEDRTGRYAAINAGFQDDDGQALPYTIDKAASHIPPAYNNNDGNNKQGYEMNARL